MIKKCLFPAAGYGTRFLPATKAMPKEMMPIVNKPLIQYAVEEAIDANIYSMAFVTGRGKRSLEDHFDISYELEHQIQGTDKEQFLSSIRDVMNTCSFSYVRQNEMKGLGHAILAGYPLIGDEAFATILADDLCDNGKNPGVLLQMIQVYEKHKCSIVAIQEIDANEVHRYGIVSGKEIENGVFLLDNLIEKPNKAEAPSNLAVIGRYIFTPDIFEILQNTKPGKNGEIQITDALLTQAKKGMVLAYKFQGKRYDCGSIDGFISATQDFYTKYHKD